jgi:P-type E1-E2 ATPase
LTDTKLIGIVAFENKLKDDAVDTIKRLKEANIQTKMITGDNIFIGIETAMRAGILTREKDIVVIEGA